MKKNIQAVIKVLHSLTISAQLDEEKIEEAMDLLEVVGGKLNLADDESIDKIDEMQDYLQYLLTDDEILLEEVQEELVTMIEELQNMSNKMV